MVFFKKIQKKINGNYYNANYAFMTETISQFYKRIERSDPTLDASYSKEKPYFNIFSRQCHFGSTQFSYRDFYKVTYIIGKGKLYYADKWILVDRPALLFSNPLVPYAWESISEEQKGMFCIFNEQFVRTEEKNGSLANTPLFKISGDKVFFPDEVQCAKIQSIYDQMQEEMPSDYAGRLDVLHCYLHLLVHTALRIQGTNQNQYEAHPNASQRITELFIELLERQFPVDYPHTTLALRTPSDYANRLSIHVNHLNKVVKETTGRTTSELIAERVMKECTQYLLHTRLSISEIAFCMGFETTSYFSRFYRKHTGNTPTEVREQTIL